MSALVIQGAGQQALIASLDAAVESALATGTTKPDTTQIVPPLNSYAGGVPPDLKQPVRDSYRAVAAALIRVAGIGSVPVYASNSAPNVTTSSAVYADFDSASVTFEQVVEHQLVEVRFNWSGYQSTLTGRQVKFRLIFGGSATGSEFHYLFDAANEHRGVSFSWLVDGGTGLGSKVVKIQWAINVADGAITSSASDHWDLLVR